MDHRPARRLLKIVVNTDRQCVYLGDASEPDDVNAFDIRFAKVNYIPGFSSYLVALDDGEEECMYETLTERARGDKGSTGQRHNTKK